MSRRPPGIAVGPLGALSLVCLALAGASCDGPGNTGKAPLEANVVELVPWQNGVLPNVDATGAVIFPDVAQYPPIELGLPDPGPSRDACATVGQYDFSTGWFDSFELTKKGVDPNETGVAPGWASYDDLTDDSWHSPGDATWYPGLKGTFYSAWGLPAVRMPGPSCDGTPNDWVMHFKGGLFRKWGGGISHAFTDPPGAYCPSSFAPSSTPPMADFCEPAIPDGATVDGAGLPTVGASGMPYLQSHDFIDVSSYDGLAFWARRGPEGSAQTLVILTDKFTSSRLARENQKYCRRYRECHSRCLNGAPCSPNMENGVNVYRCFDPAQVPGGMLPTLPISIDTEIDQIYPRCGASACTSPPSYLDRDFDDKPCTPYTFPSADEAGEYCFDPKTDLPPPGRDDRCQDGWQTVIQLSSDWHFYALPWSQFGQVGFGKKAPYMDLKSIDTLAFGAPMGWADAYFDNVTFYRRKK
jgi:hypothetical protein